MSSPNVKGILKSVNINNQIDTTKAILIKSEDVVLLRRNKIESWPRLVDVLVKRVKFHF